MTADGIAWDAPRTRDSGPAAPPSSERALAFAYGTNFAALAASAPFFAVYLADRGFLDEQVSWILGAVLLVNVVATVAWTRLADVTGSIGSVLRAVSFAAVVCAIPAFMGSPVVVVAGLLALAAFRAPFGALLDALTLTAGRRFGPIRAWGTAGYVAGALATGWLVTKLGSRGVGYATGALLVLAAAAALGVSPRGAPQQTPAPLANLSRSSILAVLARPRFGALLFVAFLSELGLAPYDSLFPAHLARLSTGFVASLAVAVGALAELVFLAVVAPRITSVRPATMLALASGASVVRWALIAVVTAPAALVAIQLLHSLSFGAFYLASITLVDEECPPSLRALSQGLFRAFAFGLAPAAVLFLAGSIERGGHGLGLRAVFLVASVGSALAWALTWTAPATFSPSDRT